MFAGDVITKGGELWLETAKKVWPAVFDSLKDYGAKIWDQVSSGLNISDRVNQFFDRLFNRDTAVLLQMPTRKNPNLSIQEQITPYASGTRFHGGGLALVGEYGPELTELPTGSRVYNTNETRQIFNRGTTTIVQHFHFSGNIDEDKVADVVCGKILEALDNV